MLPVVVAWSSSDGSAILYLLPVWRVTSCLNMMERIDQKQSWLVFFAQFARCRPQSHSGTRTSDNIVWSSSPLVGTGGEVCCLRLDLVCACCVQPWLRPLAVHCALPVFWMTSLWPIASVLANKHIDSIIRLNHRTSHVQLKCHATCHVCKNETGDPSTVSLCDVTD